MNPYWTKPDHQPGTTPVEFEVRPVDLRLLDEMILSMTAKGPATEAVHACFVRHVINWRGIDAECTPINRQKIVSANGPLFGFALVDWLQWTRRVAIVAFNEASMTEEERKNSQSPPT